MRLSLESYWSKENSDTIFSLHLVTPSDIKVRIRSIRCASQTTQYMVRTGRFPHVWPKSARMSYLFKRSFWRCLKVLGIPPIRPSTKSFDVFFILDSLYDTSYSNPISYFLSSPFIKFPTSPPLRLPCLGICWNCKISLALPIAYAPQCWLHS